MKLEEATRQCDDLRASTSKSKRKSNTKTQKAVPSTAAAAEVSPTTPRKTLEGGEKTPKPNTTLKELSTASWHDVDRLDPVCTPRPSSTVPSRAIASQSPSRGKGSDSSRAREARTDKGFDERVKHIAVEPFSRAAALSVVADYDQALRVSPLAHRSTAQDEQQAAAYLQFELQSSRQAEEYRRLSSEVLGIGDDASAGSVKSSVTTPSDCNSCSIVGAPKPISTLPVQQKVLKRKTLWAEYLDPASGLQYYHNRLTKETTWDKPSPNEMLQLLPII